MSGEVVSIATGEPLQIPLCDPDLTLEDVLAVDSVLRSSFLGPGANVAKLERAFASYVGRSQAIAVSNAALGLLIALTARGIGPGDEVILSAHSFRELGHAVLRTGARPVFADIDYWSGTLSAEKAAEKVTPATRAMVAGNTAGHPADWPALRELADAHGLFLVEDSSEAIGSRHKAGAVGSFGDVAIFDFAQPGVICCGEGGMIVTGDMDLAMAMRRLCTRSLEERGSVSATMAAETVIALTRKREEMNAASLSDYARRLEQTFVMKDLKKYKGIPALLHGNKRNFFGTYPQLVSQAMQTWFRVDGVDKKSKEQAIFRSFRETRTLFGMLGDAFKLVRAWR